VDPCFYHRPLNQARWLSSASRCLNTSATVLTSIEVQLAATAAHGLIDTFEKAIEIRAELDCQPGRYLTSDRQCDYHAIGSSRESR
jgi:hypothetical protein